MSVIFVVDSYLKGDTKQECFQNIEATVSVWVLPSIKESPS